MLQPRKKHVFRLDEVARQAVSDWFGKDVQSGYTLTYTWMANELGHFAITSIPISVVSLLPIHFGLVVGISVVWTLFWTGKEVKDVYSERKKARKANRFKFDARSVWLDALTAMWFFFFGAAFAFVFFMHSNAAAPYAPSWIGAFAAVFIPLGFMHSFAIAAYWLRRKMCFQQAGLPYQFRLSSFAPGFEKGPGLVSEKDIMEFVDADDAELPAQHVLIFSAATAGGATSQPGAKTSLAVAMATEFAFDMGVARYTSLHKFFKFRPVPSPNTVLDALRPLWTLEYSDMLVVDDVSPGTSVAEQCPVYTPANVVSCIASVHGPTGTGLLELLRVRRTVWVIGDTAQRAEWEDAFARLLPGGKTASVVVA